MANTLEQTLQAARDMLHSLEELLALGQAQHAALIADKAPSDALDATSSDAPTGSAKQPGPPAA